jgi:hypothetical protein
MHASSNLAAIVVGNLPATVSLLSIMFSFHQPYRPTLTELLAKSKSRGAAALLQIEVEELEQMILDAQKALDLEDDSDFPGANGFN